MLTSIMGSDSTAPVFVHSDILPIVSNYNIDIRTLIGDKDLEAVLMRRIVDQLRIHVDGRDLWMPGYNYMFCRDGVYDINQSVCEVGSLPEFFRLNVANWRTAVPVFSITGIGNAPDYHLDHTRIDPFSVFSDYHQLVARNGVILFYGAEFSPTFIHYIERIYRSGPIYRYDKFFSGVVIDGHKVTNATLIYHVIPKGMVIKYDMPKLFTDLVSAGVLHRLPTEFQPCFAIEARGMLEFCIQQLDIDPLYFLTESTKNMVETLLGKLGRRFALSDFNDQHQGVHQINEIR